MQFQSDILNVRISRPQMVETTALGAAMLAGRAVGMWNDKALTGLMSEQTEFVPQMSGDIRAELYRNWKKAVKRAMNWVDA